MKPIQRKILKRSDHQLHESPIESFLNKNDLFYYSAIVILVLSTLLVMGKGFLFSSPSSSSLTKERTQFPRNHQLSSSSDTSSPSLSSESKIDQERLFDFYSNHLPRKIEPPRKCFDQFDEQFIEDHLGAVQPTPSTSARISAKLSQLFNNKITKHQSGSAVLNSILNFGNMSSSSRDLVNKKRFLFQQSQREFAFEERQCLMNESSTSSTAKFFDKQFSKTDRNSKRKFAASSFYRLIPRSDSGSGQETFSFSNLTAEQCAKRCFLYGPHYCTFFTREVKPAGKSMILSDRDFWRYKFYLNKTGANKKSLQNQKQQQILHPLQARDDYLFSSFDEELNRRSISNVVCTLRVGIVEPYPDLKKELWVPAWVSEDKSKMILPGKLNKKTGKYSDGEDDSSSSSCKVVVDFCSSSKNKKRKNKNIIPSSLVAIGLLAGSMHLRERVFPALSTWLKDEPNVVAFVDRTQEGMRTVRDRLMMGKDNNKNVVINPLFGCVSLSSLRGLYREYPQHGGDATAGFERNNRKSQTDNHEEDDEELVEIFLAGKKRKRENQQSSSETKPFYCNPSDDLNENDNDDRIPGINFPAQTPSDDSDNINNNNKGTTLFRFIREPDHRTLRKFNGAWKNFIILFELPLFYPTTFWYFTVDDDAIVMWESLRYLLLLASLSNLHRRTDIYGGFLEYGDNFFFAHGGGGMVMSSGTMWGKQQRQQQSTNFNKNNKNNNDHHKKYYYEFPSSEKMIGFHERLPSCLSLCRQAYGDVRVGCCMHSIDVYERRLRFLFPYVLEKAPERYSNLLASVHRYQNRDNITRMFEFTRKEIERKRAAMNKLEYERALVGSKASRERIDSMKNNNAEDEDKYQKALKNWHDRDSYRRRFFALRKSLSLFSHIEETSTRNLDLFRFDDIIWGSELWRYSTSPRKVKNK